MTDSAIHNDIFSSLRNKIEAIEHESISFDKILNSLGQHSFDLAILGFALPMIIPMPPGIPMTAGFIICVAALQAMTGKSSIWIPAGLARKKVNKSSLIKASFKSEQWLRGLLRILTPRFRTMLNGWIERFTYLALFLLGVTMILPIPFIGNPLPALCCVILTAGRLRQDGLIVGLGISLTFLTLLVLTFVGLETWKLAELLFSQ